MADKKITDYTEKTSIVSDDFFEIFDSEEAVISERNKKIKFKNINHDYKIWYVDGDNGDSGNNGSFSSPVKTTQQAIDLRETDGATTAEIRILGGITSGTVTLASNPTKSTLITGSLKGTAITTINATDTTIRLVDITVTTLNVTQTGSNSMFILMYNSTLAQFNDTIATVGNSTFWCFNGSRLQISVAGSENFDTKFNIEDGSFMDISGGANSTWNHINLINRGTLDIVNDITVDKVTAEKSFIMLADGASLTIDTTFDHIGVIFTNFKNIDYSAATIDFTPGGFSNIIDKEIILNQAQIQALNTTPIDLVAVLGAGIFAEILSVSAKNVFNTSAFATATKLQIIYTGGSSIWETTSSFVQAGADRYERLIQLVTHQSPANTKIQITGDADATSGNASSEIKVYIRYKIIDTN